MLNLPVLHTAPVYPVAQLHSLGRTHWPPFKQAGLHTAGKDINVIKSAASMAFFNSFYSIEK